MIQLGNNAKIKFALRNQGRLALFAYHLVFKIGNFLVDVTEIIRANFFRGHEQVKKFNTHAIISLGTFCSLHIIFF